MIVEDILKLSLNPLLQQLKRAKQEKPKDELVILAEQLIEKAIQFEKNALDLSVAKDYVGGVPRNFERANSYTSEFVYGQSWSDSSQKPLEYNENWNKGRRVTNTGLNYQLDNENLPVNPYYNYGIKGQGIIGHFGPNHAVDMGLLCLKQNAQGKYHVHTLGIIRGDDKKAALCGGFTTFPRNQSGEYIYTRHEVAYSQAHEFFEELVSGSVELLPKYKQGLQEEIEKVISEREGIVGHSLNESERKRIANETVTFRKLEQVYECDRNFLNNIQLAFENAHDCFAGPVLSSTRNTNAAWMETRLSWFVLDDSKWQQLKGEDRFKYEIVAGDDAQGALWHDLAPETLQNATPGHVSLFSYLLSAYMITETPAEENLKQDIKEQAKEVLGFLERTVSKGALQL